MLVKCVDAHLMLREFACRHSSIEHLFEAPLPYSEIHTEFRAYALIMTLHAPLEHLRVDLRQKNPSCVCSQEMEGAESSFL